MTDRLTDAQVAALVDLEDPPELYNDDRDCISDAVTRALALEVQQSRQRLLAATAAIRDAHEAREKHAAWAPCGCDWCQPSQP
jgi:hypothetical protein